MSGPVTATWKDPGVARAMPEGDNRTGGRTFARPGNDAGGDPDRVLVVTFP